MIEGLTFGRRLTLAFAATAVVWVGATVITSLLTDRLVHEKDGLIENEAADLRDALELRLLALRADSALRSFLITGDVAQTQAIDGMRPDIDALTSHISTNASASGDTKAAALIDTIKHAGQVHDAALRAVLQKRLAIDVPTVEQIGALQKDFDDQVQPAFTRLDQALVAYAEHAKAELARGETSSDELASSTVRFSWAAGVLSLLVLGGAGVWLTRHLSRTVASGAQDLAASSKELQVAAAQQATATTEQSSVITEATTTMKESVITSQQICESTRHVARMAEECQRASSGGSDAVRNGHRALGLLKEQIDQIVRHMLDFGEKSRKIGTILDLVNELADQTNILAVNATIEAAGAGEHGVRFSAVASEIRKLADRVSHATREIRGLVESIRSSVNANVLATEKGQKSADDGLQKFGDVANAFDRINELVVTVTQAAREIELSTRQQATAIEQLSGAFNEAATAARETEASTRQTVQTAEQLAGLSASLLALVKSSRT